MDGPQNMLLLSGSDLGFARYCLGGWFRFGGHRNHNGFERDAMVSWVICEMLVLAEPNLCRDARWKCFTRARKIALKVLA